MKVLITGSAGFIGNALAQKLLDRGDEVVGIDCINDYYDVNLKFGRLEDSGINRADVTPGETVTSKQHPGYRFIQMALEDREELEKLFAAEKFDRVINIAAQAGVRYSLENPHAYASSNLMGFMNILECCRRNETGHLVYASSSSVYGLNESQPFSTRDNVDHPVSLYAASKKANELMAHSYSHLYSLPTTGLRFFTVYGPWGRPDMAPFLFTDAILRGRPIKVFNNGIMWRDFTYIDDIIEGVVRVTDRPPSGDPDWSGIKPRPDTSPAPYRIFNIGNSKPVKLMDFIETIERKIGREAEKIFMPMQPGDVMSTYADVTDLTEYTGYKPDTDLADGISAFIDWFRDFYSL